MFVDVKVSVNGHLFLCGLAMSCRLVHDVTLISHYGCWKRLQQTLVTLSSETSRYVVYR